jgi:hypothetical protein
LTRGGPGASFFRLHGGTGASSPETGSQGTAFDEELDEETAAGSNPAAAKGTGFDEELPEEAAGGNPAAARH